MYNPEIENKVFQDQEDLISKSLASSFDYLKKGLEYKILEPKDTKAKGKPCLFCGKPIFTKFDFCSPYHQKKSKKLTKN